MIGVFRNMPQNLHFSTHHFLGPGVSKIHEVALNFMSYIFLSCLSFCFHYFISPAILAKFKDLIKISKHSHKYIHKVQSFYSTSHYNTDLDKNGHVVAPKYFHHGVSERNKKCVTM